MAVASQVHREPGFGELIFQEWKGAGLIKPSAVKPVVFTAEKRIVLRCLGKLNEVDQTALREVIDRVTG